MYQNKKNESMFIINDMRYDISPWLQLIAAF